MALYTREAKFFYEFFGQHNWFSVTLLPASVCYAQAMKPWVGQLTSVFCVMCFWLTRESRSHLWASSPSLSCRPKGSIICLFLDLRHLAEEFFPLLSQLPQLWNVIKRSFCGLPSCVYVCWFVCMVVPYCLRRGLMEDNLYFFLSAHFVCVVWGGIFEIN